jgi:cytochrome c oxidase subunit I+III
MTGSLSHSWWAMIVVILVAGSLYLSYVFSYLYLWTVSPQVWPAAMPSAAWPILSGILLSLSIAAALLAARMVPARRASRLAFAGLIVLGMLTLAAGLSAEIWTHWQQGLRPSADAHSAMVAMASFLQAELVIPILLMGAFVLGRLFTGQIDTRRRVTFDNLRLLWLYAAGQGLFGLLLIHGFPRLVA